MPAFRFDWAICGVQVVDHSFHMIFAAWRVVAEERGQVNSRVPFCKCRRDSLSVEFFRIAVVCAQHVRKNAQDQRVGRIVKDGTFTARNLMQHLTDL